VLEAALADPDFVNQVSKPDKKGRLRPSLFAIGHFVRTLTPKGWCLAPIRDYLIADAAAMLLSHLSKLAKGKHESNPPTLPDLEPISDAEYQDAYRAFTTATDVRMTPKQEQRIAEARVKGQVRVAERLERIYTGWAISRSAGQLLRIEERRNIPPLSS
jgi:hypothetical protein